MNSAARPHHILHVFPSFGIGGVELRMASVLNGLPGQLRHSIIALGSNYDAASRIKPDVDVSYSPPPADRGYLMRRLAGCARFIQAVSPDLLLTYNWGAIEWALANRWRPKVRHIHLESGFGKEEAIVQKRRRVWTRRLALKHSEALIVPSRFLARIASTAWRLPQAKIHHIPNGVDCALYSQPADPGLQAEFGSGTKGVLIAAIAPLRPEKNIGRLLRAFARVSTDRPPRLLIIGDGGERDKLTAEAAQLGISERVRFAGTVGQPEKVIGMIDIFALSSDTEQMPNTVLQAMAAGKPVAAPAVGDIADMVAAENRPFICAPADTQALSVSLERLIDSPESRRSIGQANRQKAVDDYNLPLMIARYQALLMNDNTGAAG